MTLEELCTVLKQTKLPVTYDCFDEPTEPPYIAYIEIGRTSIVADDTIYAELKIIDIELYTNTKSPELEKLIEDVLKENGLVFSFNEVGLIESENVYEVVYTIEI